MIDFLSSSFESKNDILGLCAKFMKNQNELFDFLDKHISKSGFSK
jgi:hypothetical protein